MKTLADKKTYVIEMLANRGVFVVDADAADDGNHQVESAQNG